jgi:hypothetical protein
MRSERELSFDGRRGATVTITRPQLRWTSVTGPGGCTRLEMRWDVGPPAAGAVPDLRLTPRDSRDDREIDVPAADVHEQVSA